MTAWRKGATGCGLLALTAVLAVIVVVAAVSWVMSAFAQPSVSRQLEPIPRSLPPATPVTVAVIDINAPGRTADRLTEWANNLVGETKIPGQALRAYANAELIAAKKWPQCHLRWNTLAGIGFVETRHGTYNGNWFHPSELDPQGRPNPPIVGIPLDGRNGTAEIPDTDGGRIDGDPTHDRAIGPMQFIPESWKRYGSDANGDGQADPQQIDDAAVGSAALLCAFGRDLATEKDWVAAVMSYNASQEYVRKVAAAANAYAVRQPAII